MTDPNTAEAEARTILAWHFCADKLRDGRPIPPDGEVLIHTDPLEMCESGLHASERIIDALQYAPGDLICRVECAGTILHDTEKLICSRRTILWRVQGAVLLHDFARACAQDVLHLWEPPGVVRQYLETGDESLRAAASAAARAAASAAGAAAWAAEAAAGAAAWAAEAAAGAAAWAAEAAAGAATGAAEAAAWAAEAAAGAATGAAEAAQNNRLESMVISAHEAALAGGAP